MHARRRWAYIGHNRKLGARARVVHRPKQYRMRARAGSPMAAPSAETVVSTDRSTSILLPRPKHRCQMLRKLLRVVQHCRPMARPPRKMEEPKQPARALIAGRSIGHGAEAAAGTREHRGDGGGACSLRPNGARRRSKGRNHKKGQLR